MKKNLLLFVVCATLLFASCYNAGEGAYVGGQFGYVLGSAIGGITGGHRGHDLGALVGTMSGVAAGAAIGAATENARKQEYQKRAEERHNRRNYDDTYFNNDGYDYDDSGFDPLGRGDDRITLDAMDNREQPLEIRNATIIEGSRDGILTRGEECKVRFEIYNTSDAMVFSVTPVVAEVTGNKHVKISPNMLIENISPRRGVRYTATLKADNHLKNGDIKVMVGVALRNREVNSQTRYFTVPTAKLAK